MAFIGAVGETMESLGISFDSGALLVALAAGMVMLLAVVVTIQRSTRNNNNPPGPRGLPIIGHLHLLSMERNKPAHQILYGLSQKHGPIIHLRFGSRPVLLLSSSKFAEECFNATNDRSFASRPQLGAGKILGYNYSMLGFAPYGEYWRNARKICTLELLSSRRIQMFSRLRAHEICASVGSLFEMSKSMATKINVRSMISELMLNILFGMTINKQYLGDKSEALQLIHLIESSFVLHGAFNVGDYIPWLRWLDLQGYDRAMKTVQNKIDSYLQRIVEKHRQNESHNEIDFIDVLISQAQTNDYILDKDAFVKATAMAMLSAGVDTSSLTTEWALALLLRNPRTLKKAQNELDTKIGRTRVVEESDIPELKYLQAIVKETLRLYPAGPLLVPHQSVEPCNVGGFDIPAGTLLLVNAWAIHRDPAVWDKPLEFIPDRFLESQYDMGTGNMRLHRKSNDFAMIPFGMGRRACPGSSLALCVVQLILARLLQSFDWFVPSGEEIDMREGIGLTVAKAVPLEALVQPRLPSHLY